jgi:hypothetical protein
VSAGRAARRAVKALGLAAAVAGASYAAYAAVTWARYGRVDPSAAPDPLLDQFLPDPDVRERHETGVSAPAARTYAAARALDFERSSVIRAIFRARELALGARGRYASARRSSFLEQAIAMGWGVLAEEPGRKLVLGAVTQPWRADVVFRSVPPESFAAFGEPDYVKIVWTLEAEPLGARASIFRTETRVAATDAGARERFRRYWAFASPGIVLIRLEALRLVRRDAERPTR